MATSPTLTYNQLVSDITNYSERSDAQTGGFVDNINRFISYGEKKIAADLKTLFEIRAITGTVSGSQFYYPKPNRWRKTASLTVNGVVLSERTQEYVKLCQSEIAAGQPTYWAEYDYNNFSLAPLADKTYSVELIYYEQVSPLTSENQENLITRDYPQLILAASMYEAALFLKDADKLQYWDGVYKGLIDSISKEDFVRSVDRNTSAVTAPSGGQQQQPRQ